jgi:hypothetical protein
MIYLIEAPENKLIKIGFSANPANRLRQLQTGSSSKSKYRILAVLPGGQKRERELHSKFSLYHSHLEWYFPAEPILDFIKSETANEEIVCRVCGGRYLPIPDEKEIKHHYKVHNMIQSGAYPYKIREFMKSVAWSALIKPDSSIQISTNYDKDDLKRVLAYAWWSRAKENGLKDSDFEDYIFDHMDYLDAYLSGEKKQLNDIKNKIDERWDAK